MADQLQLRGGTTAEHATFTGALREVTVDTDKDTVVVHDNATAGGHPLAKENLSNVSAATAATKLDGQTVKFGLGAAATPSVTFNGDLNTGVFSPGADQVAISTGGSGRLFVDASGNVGVGTATPNAGITVRRNAVGNLINTDDGTIATYIADTTGSLLNYGTFTSHAVAFKTANTERLRITSAGLVGVGNSSPGAKLDVSGDVIFNGGGTQFPIQFANAFTPNAQRADLFFSANATSNNALRVGTIASNGGITLQGTRQNDSSQKVNLVLNPDGGSVGIGTSSPSALLHVLDSSSTTTTPLILRNYAASVNTKVRIALQGQTASNQGANAFIQSLSGTDAGGSNSNNDSGLQFIVTNGGGATENQAMTINTQGRVGIGTTSPAATTHCAGSFFSTSRSIPSSGIGPELCYDAGDSKSILLSYNRTSSVYVPISIGGSHVELGTGGAERARIDSSGRLLVGTSSARDNLVGNASGVACQLQIEGTGGVQSAISCIRNSNDAGGVDIVIGKSRGTSVGSNTVVQSGDPIGNIRFEGNDGAKFVDAALIKAEIDGTPGTNDMPGRLVFSTTADGASSPTERMRITNGGNIFIGTTSSGGSGWTTANAGQQVVQYSATNDTRTLYEWKSDNAGSNTSAVYVESTGKLYARTTTVQAISSERRLKENIAPLDVNAAWETIKLVPFYSYNFIGADPSNVLYGPMADEVPDEMRVATSQSDDVGVIHTYDNGMLQARLYVALQAALNKIETLEAKVAALESA